MKTIDDKYLMTIFTMNDLAEVGVEDGVDDRVEGGVEVAKPRDEHVHLHICICICVCICICIR